ncbi:MAG: hypothetical protein GYB68_17825 [Chloroflexi bacterium]|nr:hypothetical protein [Chloroflexota bacterium]
MEKFAYHPRVIVKKPLKSRRNRLQRSGRVRRMQVKQRGRHLFIRLIARHQKHDFLPQDHPHEITINLN